MNYVQDIIMSWSKHLNQKKCISVKSQITQKLASAFWTKKTLYAHIYHDSKELGMSVENEVVL